jgi:hypothetical protein
MSDSPEVSLLSRCRVEIETAWNESMDDSVVHRLAAEHPELTDELYAFFADVVESQYHLGQTRPEFAVLDAKVREVLEGARGHSAAARPITFLALVREATGELVDTIAASMHVTPDFLVEASERGAVLPLQARAELVRRARAMSQRRGTTEIDEREGVASFDVSSALDRAASRDAAYERTEVTYRELVERSSLSDADKQFWLGLA